LVRLANHAGQHPVELVGHWPATVDAAFLSQQRAAGVKAPGRSATTINIQGFLTKPNGNPKHGTFAMTLRIYNAATGFFERNP
jgi:hypothetical protein